MNMSLGGSRSNAINQAINALRAAGVVPVVAAGNEGVDGVVSPLLSLFFLSCFLCSSSANYLVL